MIHPIQRGPDIIPFPLAVIVFALAQTRSAKVEAQHRKAKPVQRLGRVKDHLVVQRTAVHRMWMAHHGGVFSVGSAGIE